MFGAATEWFANEPAPFDTPDFLVGDRAIPGAPEDLYDQLEKHVTELRKSGCSYC